MSTTGRSLQKLAQEVCKGECVESSGTPLNNRKKMIGYFIRGIYTVIRHHHCSEAIAKLLSSSLYNYFLSDKNIHLSDDIVIKQIKFILMLPMATYLHEPIPDLPPYFSYKFPKKFLRCFYKARVRNFKVANTHLWMSWLQTKRSCLEVDNNFIQNAYVDHMDSMTKPINYNQDQITQVIWQLKPFLQEINSKLQKTQKFKTVNSYLDSMIFNVSNSACYENTRGKGGSRGWIEQGAISVSHIISDSRLELESMFYNYTIDGIKRHHVTHTLKRDYQCNEMLKEYLKPVIKDIYKRSEPIRACVRGVVEPLKVRTITCGEAELYFLAKPFQKELWSILKRYECFNLIGKTVCTTDLESLRENTIFKGEECEWFSVDYKSATDELNPRLTRAIVSELLDNCDDKVRKLLLKTNGLHLLQYPKFSQEEGQLKDDFIRENKKYESRILQILKKQNPERFSEYKKTLNKLKKANPEGPSIRMIDYHYTGEFLIEQENGQLMGNPISFVILCLANLGLYLYDTREICTDPDRLTDIHNKMNSVKINGDDKLFYAPRSFCEKVKDNGAGMGLANSPGKSYIHPIYANINSQSFHAPRDGTVRMIPFLNTGLYFNQHKVMRVTNETLKESTVVSIMNELLDGCRSSVIDSPEGQRREEDKIEILKSFLKRFKKEIKSEQTYRLEDESIRKKKNKINKLKVQLQNEIDSIYNNLILYDNTFITLWNKPYIAKISEGVDYPEHIVYPLRIKDVKKEDYTIEGSFNFTESKDWQEETCYQGQLERLIDEMERNERIREDGGNKILGQGCFYSIIENLKIKLEQSKKRCEDIVSTGKAVLIHKVSNLSWMNKADPDCTSMSSTLENERRLSIIKNIQYELFLQKNKLKKLEKRRFIKNLFIPHSKGGLGVNLPIGFKNEISIMQRKCASGAKRENLSKPLPLRLSDYTNIMKEKYTKVPWYSAVDDSIKPKITKVLSDKLESDKNCYNPYSKQLEKDKSDEEEEINYNGEVDSECVLERNINLEFNKKFYLYNEKDNWIMVSEEISNCKDIILYDNNDTNTTTDIRLRVKTFAFRNGTVERIRTRHSFNKVINQINDFRLMFENKYFSFLYFFYRRKMLL